MSNIPTQQRSVDSFESYNSNITNRLNRMITHDNNVILRPSDLQIIWDGTSDSILTLKPGYCIKDDVLIEIMQDVLPDNTKQDFQFDMASEIFYLDQADPYWNEIGNYYICLGYTYTKSRTAPVAKIVIMKPSITGTVFNTNDYLFLKCVNIVFSDNNFMISGVYDYDPNNSDVYRQYPAFYVGSVDQLPDWDDSYISQLVFDNNDGFLYLGTPAGWKQQHNNMDYMDTNNLPIGALIYPGVSGALPAIGTSLDTLAAGVVISQGTKIDRTGIIKLLGRIPVQTEIGLSISIGDTVYLSSTNAGRATNIKPTDSTESYQIIGYAISEPTSSELIDVWFRPGSYISNLWGTSESSATNVLVSIDQSVKYPEIITCENNDHKLAITSSNETLTVLIKTGQTFGMRNYKTFSTDSFLESERLFTVLPNKTYHLRFVYRTDFDRDNMGNSFYITNNIKDESFYIIDYMDTSYNESNPSNVYNIPLSENDPFFDSKLDDMLIAKVVVNANQEITTTPLANTNIPFAFDYRRPKTPNNPSTGFTYSNVGSVATEAWMVPLYNANAQFDGATTIPSMDWTCDRAVSITAYLTGSFMLASYGTLALAPSATWIKYYQNDLEVAEAWWNASWNGAGFELVPSTIIYIQRGDHITAKAVCTSRNVNCFTLLDGGWDGTQNKQNLGSNFSISQICFSDGGTYKLTPLQSVRPYQLLINGAIRVNHELQYTYKPIMLYTNATKAVVYGVKWTINNNLARINQYGVLTPTYLNTGTGSSVITATWMYGNTPFKASLTIRYF